MSLHPEPIAIVGSGCRFPGSVTSPSTLWKLLSNPRDLCQPIPPERFDTASFYHRDGTHHGTANVKHAYLLDSDLKALDAGFFNISPNEADSIDPQQRLLLETVYEALEAGGHSLESLRGSDTAVYVGTMGVDYNDLLLRDLNNLPTYFATGTNRAIIANRVSYFFDWHGPSMTIDTACSSSLVAVHQGVTALRANEAKVAVACGTQVILGPEAFIFESKMKMLSPTGRSRMWDANADGYARGEGVAAIVLKRLSDALADGDQIECLIRETGTNQDGFSGGLTVPSTEAQAALIRATYARAGLDMTNPNDRPQFFEAHGTGTKAGDPREARAIHQCFGKGADGNAEGVPLYVGSVKTVIGHTEGAAGLAGVLKGVSMIRAGEIAPNLLFTRLNPDIEPFYRGLHVPTARVPWPVLPEGVPRRVSVNSFGFGGSNAHAILEEYKPAAALMAPSSAGSPSTLFTPYIFSAASNGSLAEQLGGYLKYLQELPDLDHRDLAYTLQSRRSHLPVRTSFAARTLDQLQSQIDNKLATLKESPGSTLGTRTTNKTHILGVFTGQGAQWASMGAGLIRASEYVRQRIQDLENSLATLQLSDRPQWSLETEMLAGADTSRIAEAALSQPLCTAVQIVLVDLLRLAGIELNVAVGHSSGEIAAAYAAGFFSARDAIRIAYYRGLYAHLAASPATGQKGLMMAVGTSVEDAQDLIRLRAFKGRVAIAAHNSSASVTLSGDTEGIMLAKRVFDEEKKFARLLKVDTAYHSPHMLACGEPYITALQSCGIEVIRDRTSSCSWFSSVTASGEPMVPEDSLQALYWRDNMTNSVLFADAIRNAVASDPQLGLAIEIGPHPALKGPAAQNISDVRPTPFPYTGLLARGNDDVQSLSAALGYIWTHLNSAVNFQDFERVVSGRSSQPKLVSGLPSYPWEHTRTHWYESRRSRNLRSRTHPFHEILGTRTPDSTARDMRWANVLKPSEISWLDGHRLQNQTVFPAAGYVAMAVEASRELSLGKDVKFIELQNLNIPRAIAFEEDGAGVETLVTLTGISSLSSSDQPGETLNAEFSCYACATNSAQDMELMASGSVRIVLGGPGTDTIAPAPVDEFNMSSVDADRFYASLSNLGYGYEGPFRTLSDLKRRLNRSSGMVATYFESDEEESSSSAYLIHPTTLDVAFQSSMLAYSAPGDERLWSLHVPTSIQAIRVNPTLCNGLSPRVSQLPVFAALEDYTETFNASIDIFANGSRQVMVQIEDLTIKPFAPATEANDRRLFSRIKLCPASPDGGAVVGDAKPTEEERVLAAVCERVAFYYVRKWKSDITESEWESAQAHFRDLREYIKYTFDTVERGRHPCVKQEWAGDSEEDIQELIARFSDSIDLKLISAVGENMHAAVRGETTILEHMVPDNMLDDYYKKGLGFERYNTFLSGMMKQLSDRYPHAKILEIGAGTGGATKSILNTIGTSFGSYTYTDVSMGFFPAASELFKRYSSQMTFQVLDIESPPSQQGYTPHSYDIIVASNVLHATGSLEKTLKNTRQLLKPGGFLVLFEISDNGPIRFSNIMGGLPGWWAGVSDGRKYAPTTSPAQWRSVLRKAGFGGVDMITPVVDSLVWPMSVMVSQAVDERVEYLRKPLLKASNKTAPKIESLVIMGTGNLETSRIAEELEEILDPACGQIMVLDALPTEDEAYEIPPMSVFINLVDLDTPIFKDMTDATMEGLKRLYELAKHIFWITVGAQNGNEPYHMASVCFRRAMKHEAGHIAMNNLDLEEIDDGTSRVIAEYLLQQNALDEWQSTGKDKLFWSNEPEAFYARGGQLMIPRLLNNEEQNDRTNSTRRTVNKEVRIRESDVALVAGNNRALSLVEQVAVASSSAPNGKGEGSMHVGSSSLLALRVAVDTFLFLVEGRSAETGEQLVGLSLSNSSQTAPVASVPTVHPSAHLAAVASEIVSSSMVETLSPGSNIVLHCSNSDRIFVSALERRAAARGIRFTVTTGDSDTQDASWIHLDASIARRTLKRILDSARVTHYLDLTGGFSELSTKISAVLPAGHRKISIADLFQQEGVLSSKEDDLTIRLQEAISSAQAVSNVDSLASIIPISKIQGQLPNTMAIVDWKTDDRINVEVRPLDARRLFSQNKTYMLFGLSGQIGQSLCDWMVANGAGCICLASRNPKVDEAWLKSFEGRATIKTFSVDVTNMHALERVVQDVRLTLPPIAGVANGAMILKDTLFSKMTLDTMISVLGPKIEGTRNLDAVFYDDDLDFFVLFSSSARIIGNSGQSNYAAANGYLAGTAIQRRRRGLAASAIDIGRVVGIGFVETAGQAVMQQLTRFGLMAVNEPELQQAFAETILAGYPRPEMDRVVIPDAVVTTGIRTIREDEDVDGPWAENPLFAHCIIPSKGADAAGEQTGKKTVLPVGEQLAKVVSMEEAVDVVRKCFAAKLEVMLQTSGEAIDHDAPLVQLGLDSLVAVEVRSWFLKELKVDIPVLKVVGGASITELAEQAAKKLPADLLPGLGDAPALLAPATRPSRSVSGSNTPSTTASSILSEDDGRTTPVSSTELSSRSESPLPGPEVADLKAKSVERLRKRETPAVTMSQSGRSTPASVAPSIVSEDDSAATLASSTQASSRSASPLPLAELEKPKPKQIINRRLVKTEPISFGQSRFWFLRLLLDDQTTSNVAFYYQIRGDLRIGDMERAIRVVTARHEALRTCFVGDKEKLDRAYQNVMSSSPLRLEQKDILSVQDVETEYTKLKEHRFDLESGDLIRLVLLSLSPTSHYLLVSYHHILMDGVSFQVFLSDLEKAYKGESLGAPPTQFPAFSAFQRQALESGEMDGEREYWRRIFPAGEQPPVLPLLPMARTKTRAPMSTFDVYQVRHRLDATVAGRIKAAAKAQASTPFHFYLAAFKAMLFRFTDATDLVIGIADANRTSDDVMSSIGFFLNLLALRFRRHETQTFKDAIAEARDTTYSALAHSRLPFDVLLNDFNIPRSSTYSPIFQAFFDYRQGAQEKHAFGNTQFEFGDIHPGRTSYDISLDITDNASDSLIILRAQRALYDEIGASLLLETYTHFLDALSDDVLMRQREIPLFGEEQIKKGITVGRGPDMESDWPSTLPHRIDEVAEINKDSRALADGISEDLTYSDMVNRIQAIAEGLQNVGMGPGSRVLVYQTAASDWVCSMLAIMRIGSIYVPLDIRNPIARLAAVAANCEANAILADHTTIRDVPQLDLPSAAVINVSTLPSKPSARVPNRAQAESPAAILYTSGTTGVPKGIIVTHSGLRNEIEGYTKMWSLGAERTLQQSAFTFNHSSDQIYTGLVNGGTVYIVPSDKRGDPIEITNIMKERRITYTKATPAEYAMWVQFGAENLSRCAEWTRAFGGGEPLTRTLTDQIAAFNLPSLKVYNSYGPTEISISSTKMEIDYRSDSEALQDGRYPCGYSLPNYQLYVVDEDLNPLPAGIPGEICIGGAGVAMGYLNNTTATQNCFIPNPFASDWDIQHGWNMMYRTGDIGHLRDDGAMVFHSRMAGDTQIKIRGIRIEISDIEANILATAGGVLKEAVVTLKEEEGSEFLVTHVVFSDAHSVADKEAFLQGLLSRLPIPQYMVPVLAIPLPRLPLTNHSKIDRKALKALPLPQHPSSTKDTEAGGDLPSPTMIQLKQVWKDVLGTAGSAFTLTPSTSFFLVGGNSLLAIRLQQQIRQVFNVVLRLVNLLGASTLSEMTRKIDEGLTVRGIDWDEETAPPVIPSLLGDVTGVDLKEGGNKSILVTGATGYISRHLLPRLVINPEIEKIYCIAVRDESEAPHLRSDKIVTYTGDLTMPYLGLSGPDFHFLAGRIDIILHLGGIRSFWDNYHALRATNVQSTKELVKLAAPRRIPVHYISTSGVFPGTIGEEAGSAAGHIPPTDGTNGYIASRWASERVLERASEVLGVPASIYRFLPVATIGDAELETPKEVLEEFARFVDISGVMPDMSGWEGRVDMAPASEVAAWFVQSVLEREIDAGARLANRRSEIGVDVAVLRKYLEQTKGGLGLKRIPGLKWIGQIKKLGFEYFLTGQEVVVGEDRNEGKGFESRR